MGVWVGVGVRARENQNEFFMIGRLILKGNMRYLLRDISTSIISYEAHQLVDSHNYPVALVPRRNRRYLQPRIIRQCRRLHPVPRQHILHRRKQHRMRPLLELRSLRCHQRRLHGVQRWIRTCPTRMQSVPNWKILNRANLRSMPRLCSLLSY